MRKFGIVMLVVICILAILLPIYFGATPTGKAQWNNWFHAVQKADDSTNYDTKKKVEDTCRSMIASYTSDKLVYEQYKSSENDTKQTWAEEAKMRANKTASTYNNYILENEYIWKGNVPDDIFANLEYIES